MSVDDLQMFGSRYGVDAEKLFTPESVLHGYKILQDQNYLYDGTINNLLVDRSAYRLGNRVYQAIHASLIARRLGVTNLYIDAPFDFSQKPDNQSDVQIFDSENIKSGHTLRGEFFHYLGFEKIIEPLDDRFIMETVDRVVVPLFYPKDTVPFDSDVITLHFRSGDIFANAGTSGWIPSLYVMPPASFYIAAVEYARASMNVSDVRIVFEDRQNPAIKVVEEYLRDQKIQFSSQSRSLIEDWSALLASRHLVVPFGTFGEAAALVSPNLRTLFSFRHIESHEFLYHRPRSLVETLLSVARKVKLIVIKDVSGSYIPEQGWDGSAEQMQLIRDFPARSLTLLEHP